MSTKVSTWSTTRSSTIQGLRALAKMMLSFHVGHVLDNVSTKTQVQTFDDPQAFHRFLDTDTVDVRHISVKNDHLRGSPL